MHGGAVSSHVKPQAGPPPGLGTRQFRFCRLTLHQLVEVALLAARRSFLIDERQTVVVEGRRSGGIVEQLSRHFG